MSITFHVCEGTSDMQLSDTIFSPSRNTRLSIQIYENWSDSRIFVPPVKT